MALALVLEALLEQASGSQLAMLWVPAWEVVVLALAWAHGSVARWGQQLAWMLGGRHQSVREACLKL